MAAPENPAAPQTKDPGKPKGRTGRNLPAAIGVGVVLGGLVVLTLLTVKATFLLYMGIALAIALAATSRWLRPSASRSAAWSW